MELNTCSLKKRSWKWLLLLNGPKLHKTCGLHSKRLDMNYTELMKNLKCSDGKANFMLPTPRRVGRSCGKERSCLERLRCCNKSSGHLLTHVWTVTRLRGSESLGAPVGAHPHTHWCVAVKATSYAEGNPQPNSNCVRTNMFSLPVLLAIQQDFPMWLDCSRHWLFQFLSPSKKKTVKEMIFTQLYFLFKKKPLSSTGC